MGSGGRRSGLAAGICLGLAAVVRPYALLLTPLFALDAAFAPERRPTLGWVAIGLMAATLLGYGAWSTSRNGGSGANP